MKLNFKRYGFQIVFNNSFSTTRQRLDFLKKKFQSNSSEDVLRPNAEEREEGEEKPSSPEEGEVDEEDEDEEDEDEM